jgi:hypothetical protein
VKQCLPWHLVGVVCCVVCIVVVVVVVVVVGCGCGMWHVVVAVVRGKWET